MAYDGVVMNGLPGFIKDNFSAFLEVMWFIPSEIQIRDWYEAALLVFILVVALGVIFLCDRLLKKYNPGFATGALLVFLLLSLTLGLTGLILSIPRLPSSMYNTFPVLCIGSPVFNLVLGVVASLGHRLRNHRPIAGTLLLCGAGFLFAWVLFTTFILFALRLFNS